MGWGTDEAVFRLYVSILILRWEMGRKWSFYLRGRSWGRFLVWGGVVLVLIRKHRIFKVRYLGRRYLNERERILRTMVFDAFIYC